MSDEADNEKTFASAEEGEGEERFIAPRKYTVLSSNTASHFQFVKKKGRLSLADLKQPRQKFSLKWERDFPWLRPENMDECIGFCTVCNKHLVCKKSQLERHQRSLKHQRLQGVFGRLDADDGGDPTTQPSAPEFLECGKRELMDDDEYEELEDAIEMDPEYSVEFELNPGREVKRERNVAASRPRPRGRPPLKPKLSGVKSMAHAYERESPPDKLDRYKLLKRIDHDRHELNEYYYGRQAQPPPSPLPQRDSFDIFFESVSASVKTMPPKLAAEVKSRVSQILVEFELRAICEREVMESSGGGSGGGASVMVASSTHEVKSNLQQQRAHIDVSSVPHIVYTFQPKLHDDDSNQPIDRTRKFQLIRSIDT